MAPKAREGLALDLADPLSRHPQVSPDLVQGPSFFPGVQPEALSEDPPRPRGKAGAEQRRHIPFQRQGKQTLLGVPTAVLVSLVREQVAQGDVLVPDWLVQ